MHKHGVRTYIAASAAYIHTYVHMLARSESNALWSVARLCVTAHMAFGTTATQDSGIRNYRNVFRNYKQQSAVSLNSWKPLGSCKHIQASMHTCIDTYINI